MGRFSAESLTPLLQEIPGVITGTGANQTLVIKVPPGSTYAKLLLRCTIAGVAATRVQLEAMLGEMRVKLNGVNIENITMKQHIAISEYYNPIIGNTGYVSFDFQRLHMLELAAQNGPAWGTVGESSFDIEIDQAAGSTIDLFRLYSEVEPRATELGAFVRRVRWSPAVTGTGHTFLGNLPFFQDSRLLALHIECSVPANLNSIRFACDDINVINLPVEVLNRFYLDAVKQRTIQTTIRTGADGGTSGFVHVDFCHRNYDADGLPMVYEKHVLDLEYLNAVPTVHNLILEVASIQPSRLRK